MTDMLFRELRATADEIESNFQDSGLPHASVHPERDPISGLVQDFDQLLEGQAGTHEQPCKLPARGLQSA